MHMDISALSEKEVIKKGAGFSQLSEWDDCATDSAGDIFLCSPPFSTLGFVL